MGRRIAEYSETPGALLREYVWLGWEPVAVIESGVIHFIRTDHIGRPVLATDSTGTVVWTASYDPFGTVHASTGTPATIRFPGQWFQAESGLHQNWMRDYDPTTGRYIQADPLGLVDGASVYGYAGQNPGRYVDPRGEEWRYYNLPDGNTGLRWSPGGANYCPSGDCASRKSTENIRDPWPEYEQCVESCLDSEPMLVAYF
jgi:RHS repeat-associated protein